MGVVLAVAAGLGAGALGDTFCHLTGQGFAFVSIDISVAGDIKTKWTQPLACSSGVSPAPGCWTCLYTQLFRLDAVTQTWQPGGGGSAIDSIACNRSADKVRSDNWGNRTPGQYILRTLIYQGGQCSKLISWKDTRFLVPAPPIFGG
jgi:hypothetical protein